MCGESASPQRRHLVARDLRIVCDEVQTASPRLGDDQPIEGIAVMVRQFSERENVGDVDRQDAKIVLHPLFFDDVPQRRVQIELPKLLLDLHFPDARHTQEQRIPGVGNGCAGGCGEQPRRRMHPDECVGIQQKSHASFPSQNSSGSGSLKSGAMTMDPGCNPRVRCFGTVSTRFVSNCAQTSATAFSSLAVSFGNSSRISFALMPHDYRNQLIQQSST